MFYSSLNDISIARDSYSFIGVSKAFELFYKKDLVPFRDRVGVNWQVFRDNKLNDYDVELVFTMNMPSIEAIYKKYSKLNQDTQHKAHN